MCVTPFFRFRGNFEAEFDGSKQGPMEGNLFSLGHFNTIGMAAGNQEELAARFFRPGYGVLTVGLILFSDSKSYLQRIVFAVFFGEYGDKFRGGHKRRTRATGTDRPSKRPWGVTRRGMPSCRLSADILISPPTGATAILSTPARN